MTLSNLDCDKSFPKVVQNDSSSDIHCIHRRRSNVRLLSYELAEKISVTFNNKKWQIVIWIDLKGACPLSLLVQDSAERAKDLKIGSKIFNE